jgi:predicted phage terminase large subunit-like protein
VIEPTTLSQETLPLNYIAFSRLRAFSKVMNPKFDDTPSHIKQIAQALEDVEEGKIKRLMIFMPPRHGKSTLTSEMFPAWYMGRNPTHQIIFCTYNQTFADSWGRKVRNILQDPDYQKIFPTTVLSQDSKSAQTFNTTQKGVYHAVGMGAGVTGKGANILIIDDPLKDREEANSTLIKIKHTEWYSSTAYTRLEPNGAIIIVQTRWAYDDLSGWLLDQKKEKWHVISLPALTQDENGIQHALWPERFSVERLLEIRESTLTHDWNALYMQHPVAMGGEDFKSIWLKFYDEELNHKTMNVYIFIDPANSKDVNSDNTGILVIGANKDKKLYVLDMYIDKFNYKERQDLIFTLVEKYSPKNVFIEEYAMQLEIVHLKSEMERRNYRFAITQIGGNATGAAKKQSKSDRIMRLQPYFEEGKIYMPRFLSKKNYLGQTYDVINYFQTKEYEVFSRHLKDQRDDMMDCMSRIFDVSIMYPGTGSLDYRQLYAGR